jgi:hypothetical protein
MRRCAVVLLLLIAAASAHSQTITFGVESASDPFRFVPQPEACAPMAVAPLGNKAFIAYASVEDGEPGFAAILVDERLTEIPGTRVFIRDDPQPTCLKAATSGHDILLMWASQNESRRMLFSPGLAVLQPPARFAPVNRIAWSPATGTYIAVNGAGWWELRPPLLSPGASGEAKGGWLSAGLNPNPSRSHGYDAVAANELTTVIAAREAIPAYSQCGIGYPYKCGSWPAVGGIGIARPHTATPTLFATGGPFDRPAIACARADCLVTWFDHVSSSKFLRASWTSRAADFVVASGTAGGNTLGAASDGESVLIAWQMQDIGTSFIRGAVVTPGRVPVVFTLPRDARARSKPVVTAWGENTYLVAYQIHEPELQTIRIAGTLVFVDAPSRRRSARH